MSGINMDEIYPHVDITVGEIKKKIMEYNYTNNLKGTGKDLKELLDLFDNINICYEQIGEIIIIPVIGTINIENFGMFAGVEYTFSEDKSSPDSSNYYELLLNFLKNKSDK